MFSHFLGVVVSNEYSLDTLQVLPLGPDQCHYPVTRFNWRNLSKTTIGTFVCREFILHTECLSLVVSLDVIPRKVVDILYFHHPPKKDQTTTNNYNSWMAVVCPSDILTEQVRKLPESHNKSDWMVANDKPWKRHERAEGLLIAWGIYRGDCILPFRWRNYDISYGLWESLPTNQ